MQETYRGRSIHFDLSVDQKNCLFNLLLGFFCCFSFLLDGLCGDFSAWYVSPHPHRCRLCMEPCLACGEIAYPTPKQTQKNSPTTKQNPKRNPPGEKSKTNSPTQRNWIVFYNKFWSTVKGVYESVCRSGVMLVSYAFLSTAMLPMNLTKWLVHTNAILWENGKPASNPKRIQAISRGLSLVDWGGIWTRGFRVANAAIICDFSINSDVLGIFVLYFSMAGRFY